METTNIFRILLPVIIIAFVVHRGYYIKKHTRPEDDTLKKTRRGYGFKTGRPARHGWFFSTIVFVINPGWLARADMPLLVWLRWTGLIFALVGFALLQWAQNRLGKSWSDTPRMMSKQKLITSGPYQFIRYPIYTAFILILGSTIEYFGDQYREYMKRTGRLLPKLI